MKHKTCNKFIFFILFFLLLPTIVFAGPDSVFKAKVLEVLDYREKEIEGAVVKQQNLKLVGLEGEFENKEIEFIGIDEFSVMKSNLYEIGDKVLVVASEDDQGNVDFYITDYVRTGSLWWLFLFFVLTILIIGRWKGFRSLLSLLATFFIIIKFIIPKIISGSNPILITVLGSIAILLVIIYLTEGVKLKSHIAIASIVISLVITVFLSWFFVEFAHLSGLIGEEAFSIIGIGQTSINFKGLLLAGIIIGALGVLDDVVISQISTVEEIYKANKNLSKKDIFKKAYNVGVSHISSMTNTLFLAYAGASLMILVLFVSGESAFSSWGQIINSEQVATEIVRTLAGSIGLILSVPIATYLAVLYIKK